MSRELKGVKTLNTDVGMTSFFGGKEQGRCLQLTPMNKDFVQMNERQAVELAIALLEFVNESRPELLNN